MSGSLYVVGIGPGDPELLTLKAVRILKDVACVCVPKGRQEGNSLALSIIAKVVNLDNKEIIEAYFPMKKTKLAENDCELDTKWQNTVDTILSRLNKGIDMAFITIGDPTFFSTFFYLYDRLLELNPDLNIEIIPGVSSITAAASRVKISLGLGDEKIAIVSVNYEDNLKEILTVFDTVILMKAYKVFDKVIAVLDEMNLLDRAIYISKIGSLEEKIIKDIRLVRQEDLNYFSLVMVKK